MSAQEEFEHIRRQFIDMLAQYAHAEGMKGGNERRRAHAALMRRQQFFHPRAHLFGRFIGESNRQYCRPGNAMGLNQMRDPMRDDAGLPAAGASEEEKRTFYVGNSVALLRV